MAQLPASFLSLPLELRLDIYDLALQDSREITIATVLNKSASNRPEHHIPGLPEDHIPIIRSGYDPLLLDFTSLAPQNWSCTSPFPTPAHTPAATPGLERTLSYFSCVPGLSSPHYPPPETHHCGGPECSPYSLLATCCQIRAELERYLSRRSALPLELHVSFPYGVLVLRHLYPALLSNTRDLNVAGFFTGEWELAAKHSLSTPSPVSTPLDPGPRHPARDLVHNASRPSTTGPNPPNVSPATHAASTAALAGVLRALTRPGGTRLQPWVQSVKIRTFTPHASGYGSTLEFDSAPAFMAMAGVGEGVFDTWCWKGKGGTAWIVKLRQNINGKRGRWVTNSWPSWVSLGREDWMGLVTGTRAEGDVCDWGYSMVG